MNVLAQVIRQIPPHRAETHHPPRGRDGGELQRRVALPAVGIPLRPYSRRSGSRT
jgi:hypothetical protein